MTPRKGVPKVAKNIRPEARRQPSVLKAAHALDYSATGLVIFLSGFRVPGMDV